MASIAKGRSASGYFFSAATTATLPTSASATLDAALGNLGKISEDGLTMTISENVTDFKDWAGSIVEKIMDEHDVVFKCKPIDWTDNILAEVYGTGSDAEEVQVKAIQRSRRAFVWDAVLSNGDLLRVVVPNGQITSVGDVAFNVANLLAGEIEITAFEDEDGVKAYIYTATPTVPGVL